MPAMNELLKNESFQLETVGGLLDRAETRLGKLDTLTAAEFWAMFAELDEVQARLGAAERPMPAESAQLDFITASLRKNAGRIVRACGGPAGFARQRSQVGLADSTDAGGRGWWTLDAYLSSARRQMLRRAVLTIGVIIAVLAAAALVYQKFLAPSPAIQARYDHLSTAQDLLAKQDYPGALAETNLGLQAAGQDSELLVLKGYLLEQQGSTQEAAAVYALAENIDTPLSVRLYQTRYALMDMKYDLAIKNARLAREIDPRSAQATFMEGQANERAGRTAAALALYNEAAALANQNGDAALEATIRINMGLLMQYQAAGSGNEGVTPTP
jgi:tetratricopeptide (TPR) repeat protein